jgi:plastocyanin
MVCASFSLWAFEVKLVDQQGKPVMNAYVAVPQGVIEKPSEQPAVMDQVDVAFVPHVLAIDQGQAVIFPNSDNIRHHVYSFSQPKKFEIKLYQGVPKKPIYFDKPGLVALGCNIHDSMLGYIYVSPWPEYAVTDDQGVATFSKRPDELAIWHPRLKGSADLVRQKLNSEEGQAHTTVSITLKKQKKMRKFRKNRREEYDF